MRAIAISLVSVLGNDGSEMFFVASRVAFGFLALVAGTVVAVFYIFLFLELLKRQLLFISGELFELLLDTDFRLVFE